MNFDNDELLTPPVPEMCNTAAKLQTKLNRLVEVGHCAPWVLDLIRKAIADLTDGEYVLLPKVPTMEMLRVVRRDKYPLDHNRGKEMQMVYGGDIVPFVTECEGAAGQYARLVDLCRHNRTEQ